jgi:chromate reductase, NAD(P)H dehydrogenase (quinone)
MRDHTTILGMAGSLRKDSYNRAAFRAAQALAPAGATLEIFDLQGIPPFNQDDEQHPPVQVADLKTRIRAADAILLVTPEYNYSIPGVLKNAIDWASRPYEDNAWDGKPVAVMGASVGTLGTACPVSLAASLCLVEHAGGQSARSDDQQCRPAL